MKDPAMIDDLRKRLRRLSQAQWAALELRLGDATLAVDGEADPIVLTAFVVPETVVPADHSADENPSLQSVTSDVLRDYLRDRLPGYMVPGRFSVMTELPLTASGKIDRRRLASIELSDRSERVSDFVGPVTDLEQTLSDIWMQVLGLEAVGIHDDFFELGGDSITSIQVASRAIKAGYTVTVDQLFENSTIARLAASIMETSPIWTDTTSGTVEPVESEGDQPLSFGQRRIWFLDQLEPGAPTYNIPAAFEIVGALDVNAFGKALALVTQRHRVLRSSYHLAHGEPVQVYHEDIQIPLRTVDISHHDPHHIAGIAEDLLAREATTPFDLSVPPLLRTTLVRTGADSFLFLIVMHHIITDAWSFAILFRELEETYAALLSGMGPSLTTPMLQYSDYTHWQRSLYREEYLRPRIEYWQQRLQGIEPLALPTDRPRTASISRRGAQCFFDVPPELRDRLKQLARREGASLFMVLLAAYCALLHRFSNREDVGVGIPVAGRMRKELESLVGFFINTLVIRADLTGNPSFVEFLQRIRRSCLDAFEHQELPFERLVEELAPPRDPTRTPIFQTMFMMQTADMNLKLGGLDVEPVATHTQTAKFDLIVSFAEHRETLRGAVEYRTALFDGETIERLIAGLMLLLEHACASPDVPIGNLRVLPAKEANRLVSLSEGTDSQVDAALSIDGLFEKQVKVRPTAPAVIDSEGILSYRLLNDLAEALAAELIQIGVRPGDVVGLCVGRSRRMLIGMLGILKTGAAYMPLDPAYPLERLRFMLGDASANCVVGDEEWARMIEGLGATFVPLNECEPASGNPTGRRRVNETGRLAYILYTSGSTGRPKGVMITHSGVVSLVRSGNCLTFEPDDVVTQAASLTFDASTLEIWGTLLSGACLRVLSQDVLLSGDRLREELTVNGVTVVFLATAVMNLVAQQRPEAFNGLRLLLFGGEKADPHTVSRIRAAGGPKRLVNLYGPTEVTVVATAFEIEGAWDPEAEVPIGRPISGRRVYILDNQLRLVPAGVWGEIFVGGHGLASGYLSRPDLTHDAFVPDPFLGGRMYRTGDWGRIRSNGVIEYLGRRDNQVKVRGFRIELGEVEAQLKRVPGVEEAVIVATGVNDVTSSGLVAYLVADESASVEQIQTELRRILPAYMIPSTWVRVKGFELSESGKIDRTALPPPIVDSPPAKKRTAGPRTKLESDIASIWCEVLGLDDVSIHDNFVDLGGHSFLAAQVANRLEERFGIRVSPLSILFETLGQCATACQISLARTREKTSTATSTTKRPKRSPRVVLRQVLSSVLRRF